MNNIVFWIIVIVVGIIMSVKLSSELGMIFYNKKRADKYSEYDEWNKSDADNGIKFAMLISAFIIGIGTSYGIVDTINHKYFVGNQRKQVQSENKVTVDKDLWKIKVDDKECTGKKGKKSAVAIVNVNDVSNSKNRKKFEINVVVKNLSSSSFSVDDGDFQLKDIEGNIYDLDGESSVKIQPKDTKFYKLKAELPKEREVSQLILECLGSLTEFGEDIYKIRLTDVTVENKENNKKIDKENAISSLKTVLDEVCSSLDANILNDKSFNEHRTSIGDKTMPYLQEVNGRIKATIKWNSNETGIQQKVKYDWRRIYKADNNNYQMDVDIHMGENGVSLKNITLRKVENDSYKVDLETLALAFLKAGI